MSVIQLSDEVNEVIDRAIAAGLSPSATSLVEDAVLFLLEDAQWSQDDVMRLAANAAADIEAGRYVTVMDEEQHHALMGDFVSRLRGRHAGQG